MKKGLKIAAGVVAALILLIVVVIATLPLWFDPNRYKDQIAALVENRTGRELTFLGDLDMSFFPWFGIETGAVTLSNAPGFGDTPFARVENAGAKVKLVPLIFSQEVEVSTVTLDGLVLNLAVNEQGTGNWEDLVPAKTAGQPQAPQPSDQDRISQIAPLALAVGGVQITDATIHWTDATTNTRQSITDLNLRTGSLSLTDPIPLTLSFQGQSNQPALNAQVQLTTQLALALSERIYRLQDLKVDVTVQSPQPQAEVAATLTTDVVFNQAARTITVDDLAIEGQAKQAAENIAAQFQVASRIAVQLQEKNIHVEPLTANAVIKGPQFPDAGVPVQLTTSLDANLDKQVATIPQLTLQVADVTVTGEAAARQILDNPAVEGQLAVAPFNPRQVLAKLNQTIPDSSDPKALTNAAAQLTFQATPTSVTVPTVQATVDDTTLKGQAAVQNFTDPAIRFQLAADQLNVDRYLPPKQEQAPAAATPATGAAATATQVPLDTLRQLNLEGTLSVGKLTAMNLQVSDLNATVNAKQGLIRMHPLTAKLYGGSYAGNTQLNARGEQLKITLDEQLSGIQAGPLLKDMIGDDKLHGTGSTQLALTASGNTPDQLLGSLSGKVNLRFKDGAVKGIDVGRQLRQAQALIQGRGMGSEAQAEKTDFTELTATVNLKSGVARNKDLEMKSPALRVTGQGKANLVSQQLDYVATATVVGTTKGQGGRELEELKGLPIDLKISGTFTDPKFDVQLGEALKARAKAQLKAKETELKQELKQEEAQRKQDLEQKKEQAVGKAKEKVEEKLRELFR